jgi:hypothetical protein
MDNEPKKFKLHPLTAAAAIAVILVSVTGIAAMTGLLPNFSKAPDPVATTTPTDLTPTATASQPAETPVNESVVEAQSSKPAPAKKPVVKKPAVVANNTVPTPPPPPQPEMTPELMAPPPPPPPPPCINCGVVESAHVIQQQAPASGIGAAAGALLGGVLGHQVGAGNGKTLATIAGAVGGGLAGNAVEKNSNTKTSYEVIVRMENGSRQRFVMNEQRWRSGDLVQVNNGFLAPRTQ